MEIDFKENKTLIEGLVFVLVLSLVLWLLYAWRIYEIRATDSKAQAIKEEIISQIGEDELNKLAIRTTQLSALFGHSTVSKILSDIKKSIPKAVILTNISTEGTSVNIVGLSSSYSDVSLFVAALNKQSTILKDAEISQTGYAGVGGEVRVSFSINANLK